MKEIVLGISLILILSACAKDSGKERVKDYLKENYELKSKRDNPLAKKYYILKGRDPYVEKIKTKNLEKKTKYTFYKTVLNKTMSVTPRATVVIALPVDESADIFEINFVTAMDTYSEFRTLFEGVKFEGLSEKESLVKGVSKIAETLIPYGEIKKLQKTDEGITFEIWTRNKKVNTVTFEFVEDEVNEILVNE